MVSQRTPASGAVWSTARLALILPPRGVAPSDPGPRMDDDTGELAARIGRPLGRYAELYPDIERRLAAILRNPEPRVRRRVAAVEKLARQRAEGRRERLKARYGLTEAEARVAAWLADGGDIASLARATGLSPGTLRVQLKLVFAKTGVNRQAALIKLVQSPI